MSVRVLVEGESDRVAVETAARRLGHDLVAAGVAVVPVGGAHAVPHFLDGTVAGGAVTVTVSGIGELQSVDIKAGEFDGEDADSLADLSDLIVAAYRDAKQQADALAGQSLGPIAGNLGGDDPNSPFKLGF